jgi:hypothetical protein
MRFGSPIDMAKTPESADILSAATKVDPPEYRYGHCICLDGDDLDKLGMEMPDALDVVNFIITGKVTHSGEASSEGADGKVTDNRRVEIQITSFRPEVDEVTEIEESTKARRGRFYDKTDSDAGTAA